MLSPIRESLETLSQFMPIDVSAVQPAPVQPPEGRDYRVLIMESSVPLARLLSTGLLAESLSVDITHDRDSAIELMVKFSYDLLILDLNSPDKMGWQLLQESHSRWPDTRILALSNQGGIESLVATLDHGADDCLPKPFSLLEMMARIRAIRRRSYPPANALAPKVNAVVLHRDKCQVVRDGRCIDLTPREFTLLDYLMQNPGQTLSRSQLSQKVWNMEVEANTNIVDVYIKYLRDKIDENHSVKLIRTVRGMGYLFHVPG